MTLPYIWQISQAIENWNALSKLACILPRYDMQGFMDNMAQIRIASF